MSIKQCKNPISLCFTLCTSRLKYAALKDIAATVNYPLGKKVTKKNYVGLVDACLAEILHGRAHYTHKLSYCNTSPMIFMSVVINKKQDSHNFHSCIEIKRGKKGVIMYWDADNKKITQWATKKIY
jgi:hypothetical protein